MKLIIEIIEISGRCPVYLVGDKIVLDEGFKLNLKETTALCMHSLGSILPFYNALAKGVSAVSLGLAREGGDAFVQCPDPCQLTGGGTCVFKIYTKG